MVSNEEAVALVVEDNEISYKHKYRELKRRLKYLVYENGCFENDIKESQMKLLQINREKSFLLDQLMVHETVVVSDNSDMDSTDYSSEEERSSTYSEMLSRKPFPSKMAAPVTSSPKQAATKSTNSTRGPTKKQGARGTSKQTVKAPKTVTKTPTASKPIPTLIVSLPLSISQSQQPQQQEPPRLLPSVTAKAVSDSDRKPSAIGGKGKGKRTSSSSSSGSSSSGSSNSGSGSGSSDSSDSEEPMDTNRPPPPPLLVDSSSPLPKGGTVAHPKPLQSPIRIMPPNKLTSLGTIPLLSPTDSSSSTITTKLLPAASKQTTPTIGIAPLSSSSTKTPSLVATIGGNPINIGAFHIVKQGDSKLLNNR